MKRINAILLTALILICVLVGCGVSTKEADESPTAEDKMDIIFPETLDEKIPVIFSHDGAPDDISTLVYLTKHPKINLLGVIQSYGEQHPSRSIDYWRVFLYDVIDADDTAIGIGSDIPIDPVKNEFPSGWREAANSFWGLELPEPSEDHKATDGVDLMIDLIKTSPEKVTLLVTGAQTDMALAIRKDASIAENITQIVIMGGAFNMNGNLYESPGNQNNSAAEWNIYVDATAAKIVFNSGIPLSIVSLDGSDNFVIRKKDHDKIKESNDPALALLSDLWEQSFISWHGDFKIWDIVASTAVTNPEHFQWTYDGVDVIVEPGSTHGQTIVLNNDSKITRFSSGTDYDQVRASIFDILQ